MNIYDAAKILRLSGHIDPTQTKTAYRAACKKYHPDINPAGDDMMTVINAAFEALKDYQGEIKEQDAKDYGDKLNEALNAVLGLSGLIVEVCGAWVWITGETRMHKDALKAVGFRWASKKKAWYFRPEEYRSFSRGNSSLEDIREKYGASKPMRKGHLLSGRVSA